ncbi:MAG TPA: hypothetical protein VGA37_00545 [Gemmatimonadales bacterium]
MAKRGSAETVEQFAAALALAAGDNLVSLLLRGSAARGDYDAKRSDLNVVIILTDASATALRPLADAVAGWVKADQPPPVIFTEAGWHASTDVFPIELEDMREAHRLLHGTDPFAKVATTREDLRRELEREARGKLIQLRAEYVAVAAHGKWLGALLLRSAKTFFVLFRALVRASGATPPQDPRALVAVAAELAGFDPTAFEWIVAKLAGEKRPDLAAYAPEGGRYLDAIERFVLYVDSMMR